MDSIPQEQARKDTYRIAAKFQGKFSRAFLQAVREFLPERMPMGFKAAYRNKSVKNVEDAIFGAEFGGERFVDKIDDAYFDVIEASGKVTTKELNKDFDTNLGFEAAVKKAEVAVPIIPINDYSAKWIRERSLTLVEDLNKQQRKVIQNMLADGFEKGLRAEEVYDEIKANIGLTGRESQAVLNRRALLEEQELTEERIEQQVDKYREQLLSKRAERIARTETIAADAAGRQHAWQLAQDSGQLPKVQRVWISAPPSPNPNRPCEICMELDGTTAPIGGYYESSLVGPVSGPGPEAHPS
jgi:hypothetical protein